MSGTSNYGRQHYFISTPTTTTESLSTYLTNIRFPLRNYSKSKGIFSNSTISADFAQMKRLSLKTKKLNGIQKLEFNKKKSVDYTEMAYREAVSKLKYLLAESYISKPMTRKPQGTKDRYSNTKINKSKEDVDDKSVIIDNSKAKGTQEDINSVINSHFGFCQTAHQMKTYSSLTSSTADLRSVPPEVNSFIKQQEEYIQQLQQESQFCRNQLTNLILKVREVVTENETLHYKNKTEFLKCTLDEYIHIDEHDNRNDKQNSVQKETPEMVKLKTLQVPSIVFESRISELEAQLTQAKLELRRAQEEIQSNLEQLSENCLNTDAARLKPQLEQALHGKYEAEMKMEDLQKSLTFIRNKETEALQKVKQTIDAMQQIEFENNQCKSEIKTLKEELDRQCNKLREATLEASRRIAEERQRVEHRYAQQIEQLSVDISSHWNAANKCQLESERQRKELAELRNELSQKQTFIDNLKKELQSNISNLQSKLNKVLAEKDDVEREVVAMKLAAERNDRQSCQEQNILQTEINSYKQRLGRTETDLDHLRKENLRLVAQIASLEKEINVSKCMYPEDFSMQALSKSENEKELASMTMDMKTKHEKVTDKDVTRVGKATSTSNKKRTVKVDLKVKIIPKQK
ncbi:serologically defined colon cancer antigen 8 homolog [Hylaeus anthracinus]|uniref:serologically defined colon cancer antigen 8 homolog n=1 Tax=Hylaeus anthracinus TaxID=313031 RepID=UPI0023B913E4|nr:serologically defined colon cancer antigen 8 homolog [Hylaeus anthracinus]